MTTLNLSKVDCSRGAPMGRYSNVPRAAVKLYLARVRLDSGGYDSGGAYWGTGKPLFQATDGADTVFYVRGIDRDDAKAWCRKILPGCSFYR